MQPGLFPAHRQVLIEDPEGGVSYRPAVIDAFDGGRWLESLLRQVPWQAQQRPMYDRVVAVPRLTAAYLLADPALPEALAAAAGRLQREVGVPFNAVGLNLYRDGRDSVAPHNDTLPGLVPGHPIALLSLGATRRMIIRSKQPPRRSWQIDLEHGSLLLMSHDSQRHYEHGVPKTTQPVGKRISLAFRVRPARLAE